MYCGVSETATPYIFKRNVCVLQTVGESKMLKTFLEIFIELQIDLCYTMRVT